jgi:hypothetical protein
LLSAPTLLFLLTTPDQAAEAYEKHCIEDSKPQTLEEAKTFMVGCVGDFVDDIVKTIGVRTTLTLHPSSLSQPGLVFPYL